MSRVYRCDQCATSQDIPTITMEYEVEVDLEGIIDDDEDDDFDVEFVEERHFCSFMCVAQWAFAQTLDDANQPI